MNSKERDNLNREGFVTPGGLVTGPEEEDSKRHLYESIIHQVNPEDMEDSDEDLMPKPEKRAGRRKIKIEYIEDKSRRHITFSKRKAGIMKKAYELSTLTGTQVLLLVASETGHVYTFATPKLQPLITKPEGKNLIQACLNAPDSAHEMAGPDVNTNRLPPSLPPPSHHYQHQHPHHHLSEANQEPTSLTDALYEDERKNMPAGSLSNASSYAALASLGYHNQYAGQHPGNYLQYQQYVGGYVPSGYWNPVSGGVGASGGPTASIRLPSGNNSNTNVSGITCIPSSGYSSEGESHEQL